MSLFLNLLFETDSYCMLLYSNEYLPAKFGFDTAENELSKVCRSKQATPTPDHKSGSLDVPETHMLMFPVQPAWHMQNMPARPMV